MPRKAAERWWGIEVPKDVAYYYDDSYCFDEKPTWKTFTIHDLIKRKTERQNRNLAEKRRYNRTVSCYICLYKYSENGPWYIRIQTIRFNEYTGRRMDESIRRKHNCGVFPELTDLWAETFYRLHKTTPKPGMPLRAVKFTKCVVNQYGKLIDVL
jgi:hypothetical protein